MPEPHGIVRRDIAKKLGLDPNTTTFSKLREALADDSDGWGGKQALREEMNARLDGAHPVP